MGSKVLVAAICWLVLSEALEVDRKVNSSLVKDNESAESARRLYSNSNNVVGVYASAAPYGAYSYITPSVIRAPLAAGTHVAPVSVSASGSGDPNGYLKSLRDSYGKFVASPQAVAFKAAFPQQFLPIQALPAHLSQPLSAAASPNSQYRPFAPNYFFGTPYKVPSLYSYSATPTPLTQSGTISQPLVYAGNIKNVFPSSTFFSRGQYPGYMTAQQQATGSKNLYVNVPNVQQFQQKPRQQSAPSDIERTEQLDGHKDKGQIQAAPAQTSVTAIVNGKKTVVTLDTNPPIPQLDLSLLEPLTFANPVVPQVQHFLPKISSVTYEKLPNYNVQHSKKLHTDIPVHGKNTHNSKNEQTKPKKKNQPKTQNVPVQPHVVVKGKPDGQEFSYEINTPNHKETYNEQVVSYNKETNMKPVTYSYNKQSQEEPENYSYSHSSKEPLKVTHMEYGNNESPKQLVYTLSPEEEHEEEKSTGINWQLPESESQSSMESNDDRDSPAQSELFRYDEAALKPGNEHSEENDNYSQRHNSYRDDNGAPKQFIQNESPVNYPTYNSNYQDSPQYQSSHKPPSHVHHSGRHHSHHDHQPHFHESNKQTSNPIQNTESPKQSHILKAEHRGLEYKQKPKQELQHKIVHGHALQYYAQPLTVTVHNAVQPITREYEEDITILPTHAPNTSPRNAHIKVDPVQNVQIGPSTQYYEMPPSPAPQKHFAHHQLQDGPPSSPSSSPYLKPFSSPSPHVHTKSKQVIIKKEQETPEQMRTRMEQVMAEMADREENDEANFEKAYKESAFGFPAYESAEEEPEDREPDIYNPDSYGAPRYQTTHNVEENPFENYQAQGDVYPKSLRSAYKDARKDNEENYYLDFSVNKPDVYADFYKKKADYYKTYKKHKPEKLFYEDDAQDDSDEKKKEGRRNVVAASSFLYPVQKPKQNKYISHYKAPTVTFEYDYAKGTPRNSNAFAAQPYNSKYRTNFVEPQFQYGFEPITASLVLDSELAAMASNNSPESEKPGMRKKIYKENWYIKKTTTAAGKPS